MLTVLVLVFGLVVFVEALLLKFNLYERFKDATFKGSIKFLYRLSNCNFCIRFWVCVFVSILVLVLWYFKCTTLLIPFVVSGYLKFLEDDSRS